MHKQERAVERVVSNIYNMADDDDRAHHHHNRNHDTEKVMSSSAQARFEDDSRSIIKLVVQYTVASPYYCVICILVKHVTSTVYRVYYSTSILKI